MTNRVAIKKPHFKLILILLVFLFIVMGLTFSYSPAKAVTTITVNDSWTWQDLKTAIETTHKGTEVVFNINRTSQLSAASLITVPSGTTVTLTCTNTAHTSPTYTDICRNINYHGSLFEVSKGGSLIVECCISGGAESLDGAIVYDKTDDTGKLITNTAKLSTILETLRSDGYRYAPVNRKYYGSALISVKGYLEVNGGILKYNYNPYSTDNPKASIDNANYNNGVYSSSNVAYVNNYQETLEDGTKIGLAYYSLPCKYNGDTPTGVNGSAISIEGGYVSVSDASLYGCSSDAGSVVNSEGIDYSTSSEFTNTQMFMNVARNVGGAVYHASNISTLPNESKAPLMFENCRFYYNRAQKSGGAIMTDSNTHTKILESKIYNNTARTYGGGLAVNVVISEAEGNTTPPTYGGKTYISNCEIYNNTSEANGGSIYNGINGGGIYNGIKGNLTISGGTISANTALYGGGLYNDTSGNVTFSFGTIENNTVVTHGGGIYNSGTLLVVKGGSINSNTAVRGGGVYNIGASTTFNMVDGSIKNNTAWSGGGIYFETSATSTIGGNILIDSNKADFGGGIYNNTGTLKITGGTISNNNATEYGGGISNDDYGIVSISTCTIKENEALINGGGIYNVGKFTFNDGSVLSNTAVSGGGVFNVADTSEFIFSNGTISENESKYGGGIFNSVSGTLKMLGGTVSNNTVTNNGGGVFNGASFEFTKGTIGTNTANNGGGIYNDSGTITISSGSTNNNKAKSSGGGIFNGGKKGTLKISGGTVSNNTASKTGGGIHNVASVELEAGSIEDNTVTSVNSDMNEGAGGGIFVSGAYGSLSMKGGTIAQNTAQYGGGISLTDTGTATIMGGNISSNTANEGGGLHIQKGSVAGLTSNSIYGNTAELGSGVMLYDTSSVFNMSGAACVGDTNRDGKADTDDIYLNDNTFVSVPSLFTILSSTDSDAPNIKALRAIVVPDTNITGRVIAKYGGNINLNGSAALYWNASTKKMNEQYFTVKGKELHSGDQGAAENYKNLNNQDIFITEKYNITFDMNPPALNTEKITHTIDTKEYVFNDLNTTKAHTPFYKYWYEELTFNAGNAVTSSDEKIEEWNTEKYGTGESIEKNKIVTLSAEQNKDYTLYAQWEVSIEIDYNGNGATKGSNFTDKGFSMIEPTYTLNTGKKADGAPVFERKEIDDETGETKLFSFTGWSFNKNDKACRYKKGEIITTDALRTNAVIIDGRLSFVTTIYAIWDQYPTIKAVDRWFTLDEAQKGKITLAELLLTAKATDGEVGKKTNFYDKDDETDELIITGKEEFTIIDFNKDDFKEFTTSGKATVTYKAVDSYGNETYKTVTVHIVDDEEQKQDETTRFTRFISTNYFKDINGDFVEPQYGGLKANSLWRTNTEYSILLDSTLSNTKNVLTKKWDTVEETWYWSIDEIALGKYFVKTNGVGNTENPTALKDFYDRFGPDK